MNTETEVIKVRDSLKSLAEGVLHVKVFNREGALIEDWSSKNLVVSQARNIMRSLLATGIDPITKLGVGTGTVAPTVGDTSLTNMEFVLITEIDVTVDYEVTFGCAIDYTELNGMAMTEFGLLTLSDLLFSRKTRSPIYKDTSIRLEILWTIKFLCDDV